MGTRSRGGTSSGLLLLLCLHSSLLCSVSAAGGGGSGAPYVGVTIGTAVTNLLSPSDLAEFLRAERITHVRLYDADPRLLTALASSGATAIVGVPNDELLALGSSPATASAWVARRVLPFAAASSKNPGLISAIAVGDEVPTALPSALPVLLPAIQSLAAALAAANLSSIPVSTPLPFSIVLDPFPPSQAHFNQSLAKSFLVPLLAHLANTSAPLMLNLYPYYALMQSGGVVPVDNAMFKPLPPSLEMVDPNTLLHYTNVFDAMLDAVYVAVRNLNVTTTGGAGAVPVLVTETGWPSYGDRKQEPYASRDNANTYNSNLIKHVATDKPGTPMRPGAQAQASVYIYELFNEDLRPGPVSEANFGLFHGNGTPVYLLHANGTDGFLGNDTTDRTFCIAADDADEKAVQAAMDWACGPGRSDCTAIQPGEGCFQPNDVRSHASFAFNTYYQSQGKAGGSCYFQGAGMVTTTDPSHDSCIFLGSKLDSNVTKCDGANSTTPQTSDAKGSAIWRLRTGRENGFLLILRLLLSGMMAVIMTNSNFWT
ncbi:glucan endo-1,3-beta-glucosidase 1-like isoform X1 [Lolium rigidum]|uniref:glucan endo-1,3-beta-glucosidase 1-like isoform X1 n=1 Tax=Lolium rigidum TaxID=89674 RepID=UPI001F5CDBA3|nr:glucan endo-1,3-beta-glucosidase 1-like isoform X1 [Lolium rigidum]